jgi:hypothetical protein
MPQRTDLKDNSSSRSLDVLTRDCELGRAGTKLASSEEAKLIFPELLEKTALVEFLKQGEIDEALRSYVPCPRLRFSQAI